MPLVPDMSSCNVRYRHRLLCMGLFSMFSQRAGAMLRRRPSVYAFATPPSCAGHALPRRSAWLRHAQPVRAKRGGYSAWV